MRTRIRITIVKFGTNNVVRDFGSVEANSADSAAAEMAKQHGCVDWREFKKVHLKPGQLFNFETMR